MSFTIKEGDKNHPNTPICIVKGGNSDGEIIYVKKQDDINNNNPKLQLNPCKRFACDDGVFEQLPTDDVRVVYIAGKAGAGKSTYASNYISKYKQLHKNAKFYCFSKLDSDPVIDKLKPLRINLSAEMINDPIEIDDIEEGSIILFDDSDNITDKALQNAVETLKGRILELGRHRKLQCVITSHLVNPNEKKSGRIIMNELHCLVFFPQSGGQHGVKYCLKQYFGLSTSQVNKIVKLPGRWVMITQTYPGLILTPHKGLMINELDSEKI